MKYSESEIDKKISGLSSLKSKNINRLKTYFHLFMVSLFVASVFIICFEVFSIIKGIVDKAPKVDEINFIKQELSTTFYDSSNKKIKALSSTDINSTYVQIDEIPDCVRNAFIAIEDAKFYEHKGIDLQYLIKAIYSGITNDNSDDIKASSTITQQLLNNQVFGGESAASFLDRISQKIQEQYITIEFENQVDKEKILEYYLNTINLGKNLFGVDAASIWYFDKSVSDLNISEAAVLASIVKDTSEYEPLNNQENNSQRRKLVLKAMLDEGYIKESEYEDALGDDVYARIDDINEGKSQSIISDNSYYIDAVVENVVKDMKKKLGYTETQAYNMIYRNGLKIYTCQDEGIQKICDEVINNDKYYPSAKKYLSYHLSIENSVGDRKEYSEKDIKLYFAGYDEDNEEDKLYYSNEYDAINDIETFKSVMLLPTDKIVSESIELVKQPQTSFVFMENSTGRVLAISGGRTDTTSDYKFNRATTFKRQPGSIFKILSTYVPALDTCGMTLATVQDDAPYKYFGTNKYVGDWDKTGYRGLTTLRDAIINSDNIVAIKTFEQVTPQTGYDYLLNMGFTSLVDKKEDEKGQTYTDIQLSTSLGDITDGVINLEVTAAYASIANGGTYIEPSFYTKVTDSDGNIILDNEPSTKRIMKKSTAWLLTNAMEDVIKKGTGKEAKFDKINVAQAGKTGITSENTDYWFEGYTPYYTAGIWSGYDMEKPLTSDKYVKIIWKTIMERVHKAKNLDKKIFTMPVDITMCKICTKCGFLAITDICDKAEDGNDVRNEFFAKGTEPTKNCNCHIRYNFTNSDGELESKILLQKDESGYDEETDDTPFLAP